MIIIGKGYAHGLALQEHSQIIYATTTVHQPLIPGSYGRRLIMNGQH